MPRPFTASELVAADLDWLLDLPWGGQVYRFGSRAVTVNNDDGEALRYAGQMGEIAVDLGFDLLSDSPDVLSIPLQVYFQQGVDVAALVESGRDLAAATGELCLWIVGTTYENRRRILIGNVSEPEYGAPGEPVSFTLEDLPYEDRAIIPAANLTISGDTFASLPNDNNDTQPYPIVFGEPGAFAKTDGTAGTTRGSSAFVLSTAAGVETLLLAGHHVKASTVKIRDATGKNSQDGVTVSNTIDALGSPIATAINVNLGGIDNEYYAIWNNGGGIANRYNDGSLSGGGELLRYVLGLSSLRVDAGKTAAAEGLLNQYRFAGYIDDSVSPWEWLQDNVLPLLPLSIANGPDGVYPIVWRLDAKAGDAAAHLDASKHIERAGPVTYNRRDVVNELSLSFAYDAERGIYKRKITLSGDGSDLSLSDVYTNAYARVSQMRYGKSSNTLETDIVYDQNTAEKILNWKIRASAFPSRAITYTAPASMAWLQRGDVVTLTDSDLSLSSQVALVQSVSIRLSSLSVTLLINEDPFREL